MYKRSDASAKLKPGPNVSGADLAGSDIKEAIPTGTTAPPSMARNIARRSIAGIDSLPTKTSQTIYTLVSNAWPHGTQPSAYASSAVAVIAKATKTA
jgi:hypothetical protein